MPTKSTHNYYDLVLDCYRNDALARRNGLTSPAMTNLIKQTPDLPILNNKSMLNHIKKSLVKANDQDMIHAFKGKGQDASNAIVFGTNWSNSIRFRLTPNGKKSLQRERDIEAGRIKDPKEKMIEQKEKAAAKKESDKENAKKQKAKIANKKPKTKTATAAKKKVVARKDAKKPKDMKKKKMSVPKSPTKLVKKAKAKVTGPAKAKKAAAKK
jgi:hypothetical protein